MASCNVSPKKQEPTDVVLDISEIAKVDLPNDQPVNEWLSLSGLSSTSINKLIEGGYTMALFAVCTEEDIDEIGKEFNLSTSEKAKLKRAVNKLLENKTNKLQLIDSEEGDAIIGMQEKINLFLDSINNISVRNKEINGQHKNCEKLLNDTFNKIELQLKERKKELSQKLLRMVHIKNKILSVQNESIKNNLNKANKIKKECHRFLDNKENEDMEQRKQFILNKENEIKEFEIANNGIPKVSPYLSFEFQNDYKYLLHTISHFGNVLNGQKPKNGKKHNTKTLVAVNENKNIDNNEDEWDKETMGDNIALTTDRHVICNEVQSYCYRSCFGQNIYDKGIHHWRLQIKQYHHGFCAWNMLIGVMKIDDKQNKTIYNYDKQTKLYHRNSHFTTGTDHGYGFIGNLSNLTTSDDKGRAYGTTFVKIGEVIDIYLDLNKYTLSYKINNIGYGIAYDNLMKTRYCLAVTFCGNKNQLQMLKYDNEKYTT